MPSTVNQTGLNTCIIQDKGDPYIEDETELVPVINPLYSRGSDANRSLPT